MKEIPYVPEVLMTDSRRKPIMVPKTTDDGSTELDDNGQPKIRQASISQRELFVQRMDDPVLVQGMEPLAAARFLNALYDAIEGQSDEVVRARGKWKFEDAHADALCKAVRRGPSPTQSNPHGGYNTAVLHNLAGMLDAVENVKPWKDPEALAETKQSNGTVEQSVTPSPSPEAAQV